MSVGYMAKCGRKKRHETMQGAENQRSRMIRAGKWRPATSNAYPCNFCGGFHAGRKGSAYRGKNTKIRAQPILHTQ